MTEPDAFHVDVTTTATTITMTVHGDIDPSSVGELEGEIRAALFGAPDASTLALDLADVAFMDSSGLRVLITVHKLMDERRGDLVVRHPSPTVSRLLEVTKLTGNLTIED